MSSGRLVFRVLLGGLFVGHGAQKLFGSFGGGGPEGTGEAFESAGLEPGRRNALAAGAAEASGGALLAVGLAAPLAASVLSGVMLTAIRAVHWKKGVWNADGGWEYPAVIVAALFALTEVGPGRPSLDVALGRERRGMRWALAELGAAAVVSHVIVVAGRGRSAAVESRHAEPGPAREPALRRAA